VIDRAHARLHRIPGGWTTAQALTLAGILIGATAIRFVALTSTIGRLDGDEAATGIMARDILHGHYFAYLAGSNYMGALEQYLQAGTLAVLPSNPTDLRLVQVALCAVTCLVVGVLGRRVTASGWGGLLAAAIYAVGPYYNVYKGIHSHGAYDAAQLIGVVAMLLALNLTPSPRSRWVALGLGLCVGLGVWESSLSLFLVVPAVAWAIASARGSLVRLVPFGIAGAIIGDAPSIGWQFVHGFVGPWSQGTGTSTGSISTKLTGLVHPLLEMFLGVSRPFSDARAISWLPPVIILAVALGLLAAGIVVRWRGMWDLITLRMTHRAPIDMVLVGFVLFALPYGFSAFTTYTREPRYLFTLYPLLALALAWAVHRIPRKAIPTVAIGLVATVLVMTITTLRAANAHGETIGHVNGMPILTQDMPAVVAALLRVGAHSLYANYWLAYPIAFAADGNIAVAPSPGLVRFHDQAATVARDPDPAFAAPIGPPADALQAAIAASGATAERINIKSIAIFVHVTPTRRPHQLRTTGG
jgi:hypothetical protein